MFFFFFQKKYNYSLKLVIENKNISLDLKGNATNQVRKLGIVEKRLVLKAGIINYNIFL